MNWGVAFKSESREIASMMVPMLYQREDLRRCEREKLKDVMEGRGDSDSELKTVRLSGLTMEM